MARRSRLLAPVLLAVLVLARLFALTRTAGQGGLPPGGDFTLQSADGPVALHDLRGKAVLLFFGFTHCPGVCPAALASHAAALQLLRPEQRLRVVDVFVSVDPERDTPALLKDYAQSFSPKGLGLTGAAADLQALARRYGAFYARQPADADGNYSVDHSADTFLIAPNGKLVARLPQDTPPEAILAELRRWI